MHILITGGSGFIGRQLIRDCLASGASVSVLTRDPAAAARVLPRTVRLLRQLPQTDPPDAIVNLAGENLTSGRWTPARKQAFRVSRVDFTRHLVDWLQGLPPAPRTLVSGSAIGYYGARGDERLDETAAAADDFAATLCRDWEAEARRAEALGVRVCTLRIGIVLDRDGGALANMLPPFRLGAGGPMGSGRQWMSWIHRRDLVALIRWLIENPSTSGAYNGTAPEPVRNQDFARALGRALNRPALLPMPAGALHLMFGEMADLLLTGQRVVPARALAEGFDFEYPDLPAALGAILAPPPPGS